MLDILKLVRGAVADKDIVPVLTHYLIEHGRVTGSNGRITLQAPCDVLGDLHTVVPADAFIKAITACGGDATVVADTVDTVVVKHGRTRVKLNALPPEQYPAPFNTGDMVPTTVDPTQLVRVLELVRPFVGTDALRLWSHGVLLRGGYAYATNNITVVRVPCQWAGPDIVIPSDAVDELLALQRRRTLLAVAYSATAVRAEFGGGTVLHAQLLDGTWPDVDVVVDHDGGLPSTFGLLDVLERLAPLAGDGRAVDIGLNSVTCGTAVAEVDTGVTKPTRFNVDLLCDVLRVATHIDFDMYPKPVKFRGTHGLEGAIAGMSGAA